MSPLYIKVEMDDLGKLSSSVGKEKYKFVVSGFAMKLNLNLPLVQDEYSCSIPEPSVHYGSIPVSSSQIWMRNTHVAVITSKRIEAEYS